jgi:hypothetical protein
LDGTTEDGEAAIVYVGRVTLGWLPVPYFELLSVGPGGRRRWRRPLSSPQVSRKGQVLELAAPALGLRGRWEATTVALDVALLEARAGRSAGAATSPAARASCACPTDGAWRAAGTPRSSR